MAVTQTHNTTHSTGENNITRSTSENNLIHTNGEKNKRPLSQKNGEKLLRRQKY